MQMEEAITLLGLVPGDELGQLRQKYHERMRRVHPDVAGHETGTPLSQRLNEAYALLKENWPPLEFPRRGVIHVPENPRALVERTIWMEDSPFGEEIILLQVGRGRYYWDEEQETFPLFLKSVMEAALEMGQDYSLTQKERVSLFHYLLQCFVDPLPILKDYALRGKIQERGSSLAVRCFLSWASPTEEEMEEGLPVTVSESRILPRGREDMGQVSFTEDCLYYVITPLLVQGVMEGRVRTAGGLGKEGGKTGRETERDKRRRRGGHREGFLLLTPTGKEWEDPTERVNEGIRRLLRNKER